MFVPQWKELNYKRLGPDEPHKKGSTRTQIDRYLEKDILPIIGFIPIEQITRVDVLSIIRKIEKRGKLSIAEKVRSWLTQIFRHAVFEGLIDVNPALDMSYLASPKPPAQNNPHLEKEDIPQLLVALANYPGDIQTKLGLKLLLLTCVRPGEVRFAKPHQFDLDKKIWLIPAGEIKQFKRLVREGKNVPDYIIPLSNQAVAIVKELLAMASPHQPYLLCGRIKPDQPISDGTLNMTLKRIGYHKKLTSHGIRGTISTALYDMDYNDNWIETQLSHQEKNEVKRAYNHAKYVSQRRKMMQEWADLLDKWEQQGQQKAQECINNP